MTVFVLVWKMSKGVIVVVRCQHETTQTFQLISNKTIGFKYISCLKVSLLTVLSLLCVLIQGKENLRKKGRLLLMVNSDPVQAYMLEHY